MNYTEVEGANALLALRGHTESHAAETGPKDHPGNPRSYPEFDKIFALRNSTFREAMIALNCTEYHLKTLLRRKGINDWRKLRVYTTDVSDATPRFEAQVTEQKKPPIYAAQGDAWVFCDENADHLPTSWEAVEKRLEHAFDCEWIRENTKDRLKELCMLLSKFSENGTLTFETPDHDPLTTNLSPAACILGWSKIHVGNPVNFNSEIRQMVEADQHKIWKSANGKGNQELKNPTRGVYELLRLMGVTPGPRARIVVGAENGPSTADMVYHKYWVFKDGEAFRLNRERLVPGFKLCPEEGGRARKRSLPETPVPPVPEQQQHANVPT